MKQSAAVVALFLGTASTIRQAPKNINLFATGANGDEDLGLNIIMKGDKNHYNQFSQVEITEEGAPSVGVRFVQGEDAKDAKKDHKKEDKKDAKDAKDAKADKKEDKKDDKKDDYY